MRNDIKLVPFERKDHLAIFSEFLSRLEVSQRRVPTPLPPMAIVRSQDNDHVWRWNAHLSGRYTDAQIALMPSTAAYFDYRPLTASDMRADHDDYLREQGEIA